MKTKKPRLLVPATMAISGSAIAIASLVGTGWGAGLSVEALTVAASIGYYVLGGRDTDIGAAFGGRPDERQESILVQAGSLAGIAATVVALVGFVITTAFGTSSWQFALIACVAGASFVVGEVALSATHRAKPDIEDSQSL
jgi:hypothetical protein